jgi:cyclophilin family peptidyl-prolyl cis-trans isomerase
VYFFLRKKKKTQEMSTYGEPFRGLNAPNTKRLYEAQYKKKPGEVRERSRAFFDIKVGDAPRGRIVFELYDDVVPKTCENFKILCTNQGPPNFKKTIFHRIVPGFLIQGGDFENKNGRGGYSVVGEGTTFEDETFAGLASKHEPYALAMCNAGTKDSNGSQFFIELGDLKHLAGKHVVFGKVVEGKEVVKDIENQGTQRTGNPTQRVEIESCGLL